MDGWMDGWSDFDDYIMLEATLNVPVKRMLCVYLSLEFRETSRNGGRHGNECTIFVWTFLPFYLASMELIHKTDVVSLYVLTLLAVIHAFGSFLQHSLSLD
jgi:hypothetical protein